MVSSLPYAENVLFVFAHQDDEVGAFTRIAYERRSGNAVWCAYLTDGALKVAAAVRDAEALAVLAGLGVEAAHVGFIADGAGRIPDGALMANIDRARAALRSWVVGTGVRFGRAFSIDWEGGHADHDAAHLITLAVARDVGIPGVWAFSMYNAYRRRRGLFRVSSFVPSGAPVERRRLTFAEALAGARVVLAYPSQRRTWLALGPGWALKTLLRREERVRRADPGRLMDRPHEGPLLYETMFNVDADAMLAQSLSMRRELSASAALPPNR